MESKVNYTLVGIFVISLVTVTVFAILWLSSGLSSAAYTKYMVFMQESVSGLSVDAPVEYNGVHVGNVKSIMLNPDNPNTVEILLNIKNSTPITQGTTAMLATKGITGIAFIALKDNSIDLTPLKAEKHEPYPVIKTIPSLFLRLDTALQALNKNLSKVSDSIQSVLDETNQKSIRETLKNLSEFTGALAENSKKIDAILANTVQATSQLTPTLQMLSNQTLPKMNNTFSNINSLTTQIKRNPSVLIRGSEQQLGPGEK